MELCGIRGLRGFDVPYSVALHTGYVATCGEWLTKYRCPIDKALLKIPEPDIQAFEFTIIGGHTEEMVDKGRRLGGLKALEFFKFLRMTQNSTRGATP